MSRGRRILKGLLGQGLAEVVNKILPFVILHVVVTKLGAASYGYADFGFRLIDVMLPLVTLGYLHLGAVDLGQADSEAASRIVSEILILKLIHAIIMVAVLLIVINFVPTYQPYRDVSLSLSFLFLTTALDMGYVHIGQRRILSAAVIQMAVKIISLVAILLFVEGPDDAITFAVLSFGANGLVSLGTFVLNCRKVRLRLPTYRALWLRFQASLPFALMTFWGVALYRYDLFIVERVADAESYGLYSGATRVMQSIRMMLFGLQTVFLAEAVNARSRDELTRVVNLGLFGVLTVSLPMAVGVWSVDSELLSFILTSDFYDSGTIFSVLVLGIVFQVVVTSFGTHVLLVKKETRLLNTIYPLCLALGIGTALAMQRWGSMEGIAWSSVLSKFMAAALVFMFARRHLGALLWSEHAKVVAASLLMGLVVYTVAPSDFSARIALGAAVYGVAVYYFNRARVKQLFARLFHKSSNSEGAGNR